MLESLESLTGQRFDRIRVVGGGARNRLLNQFTADATGCRVTAGPVEATALGNVATSPEMVRARRQMSITSGIGGILQNYQVVAMDNFSTRKVTRPATFRRLQLV